MKPGMQANQQIFFLSDGADNLRDLQFGMYPESTHVLDWFHITMRLKVLMQYAVGHEPAFRMTVILLNKTEAAGVSRRTNGKRLPGKNFKITLFVIPIANITTHFIMVIPWAKCAW